MKKIISLAAVLAALTLNACGNKSNETQNAEVPDFEKNYEYAQQGMAEAQYNLGIMYQYGEGAEMDLEQAFYWFKQAADQGMVEAQYNLGYLYITGQGTEQDYEQAMFWFMKAADQGDADALYNIGYMYYEGLGVKQDYEIAKYWFGMAAEQGSEEAKQLVEIQK
jgi:hypothetical protein